MGMRTLILVSILAAAAPAETRQKLLTPTPLIQSSVPVAAQAPQPLTDEEQQSLKQRDEKPAETVAGGALSNEHLTYIVIALAAAVLVLVLK